MVDRRLILHPALICADKNKLTVSAQVTSPENFPWMPRSLWYRFPAEYRDYTGESNDAQVVALFLVAMGHGLDLQVLGPMSSRLLHSLNELQQVLARLFPTQVKIVTIDARELVGDETRPPGRGVAAPFSGGADSFYTLWSHLPHNDPDPQTRLTHGIFVHGLDFADPQNFEVCRAAYSALYRRLGLELLTAATNVRDWYTGMEWSWNYFAPVLSPALVLDKLIGRLYAPSNSTIFSPPPWDEFTLLDRFFSTDSVEVVGDAVTVTKANKLYSLARWDATYDSLRVCYKKINGLENCCRCHKCLYTMIALELADSLSRYTTFPLPLTRTHIRRMHISRNARSITWTVYDKARELGRRDTTFDMSVALAASRVRWFLQSARDMLLKTDEQSHRPVT